MATEKTLTEHEVSAPIDAAETAHSAAVRELLRLVVKAQKAQRLYEGKNAVSERLESELFERLSDYVENENEIHLNVLEFQLKCDDEVVYDSHDRNDSLAFLLYRDGVRKLSFHGGLVPEELTAFLFCLNRVAVLANDQDDLVTLFWEQDFHAIRYFAIEELSAADAYPRLSEQLATGELSCEGAEGQPEGVSLDLEQPVSTVPVEACRLSDDEIEALRDELASELAMPFQHVVSELAIELTFLEEDTDQRLELVQHLAAIADRLVADGALDELAAMEEHLDGLATMVFPKEERITQLSARLLEHLSKPEHLEAFLTKVDEHHVPKPDVLTAYLARMGGGSAEALLPWMGRLSSSAYRRAVTNALLVSPGGGLDTVAAHLPLRATGVSPREQLEHRQLVREVLHALSHHPGERALPVLERMLDAADPETRRESFVAITRYPEPEVAELAVDRLQDPDPELRATALDTLVRRGEHELGTRILDWALKTKDVDGHSLNEKRRLFAAVAKLCGEAALEPLSRELANKEERWFTSKKEKEFAEAVAHGIRVIGSDAARSVLKQYAGSGARFVRAACTKELGP